MFDAVQHFRKPMDLSSWLGANNCDANGHREDLQRCQGSKDAVLCDAQRRTLHQLKTYFGASASFGHTCAMLAAASAARNQGTALIVELVQTHGRAETESMARDRRVCR